MANARNEVFASRLNNVMSNIECKRFRLATKQVEQLVADCCQPNTWTQGKFKGGFEGIMKALKLLEKESPNESLYKVLKARLHYSRSDYSNADVLYKKAMAVSPENAVVKSEYNRLLARGSEQVDGKVFLANPKSIKKAPQRRPDQWRIKASPANQGLFSEKERAEKRARLPNVPSVRLSPNLSRKAYKK